MLPISLVVAVSFAYLLGLFAIAAWGDARARRGRSVIGNAWVYTLSLGVYCTAWTYYGSVGRAAGAGVWFLPIYLGPTLAFVLAWLVLRKMVVIARAYRITSIADFIASRYGKSPLLAGTVTLITVVGIVPYIALQLKAVASGYALLAGPAPSAVVGASAAWWHDTTFYFALALAGFTIFFGARHLDSAERHEGMVAAIAAESVVKLVAFVAVGGYVCWALFDGPADLFARAREVPALAALLRLAPPGQKFAYEQWFALTVLAMLSVVFLPRQFQMIVVENVSASHLKRASWAFPLYLLAINLFVLPIALGGRLHFGASAGVADADTYVLSLPLAHGEHALALLVFVGGLSAATGMVIVEAIAVSTMVCNDLVMPLLLRTRRFASRAGADAPRDLSGWLLGIRRAAIVGVLLLGYAYYAIAGDAYALVSIGLISFAAVAQFAPALLAGMYWKGGTKRGAFAGLVAGFALWSYTLMLPSVAKSGWLGTAGTAFVAGGPFGIAWLAPEQLFGLAGLDNLTHALFWSLAANVGAFVALSLARAPSAREVAQALLFVDAGRGAAAAPVFWRGRASVRELLPLAQRFLGAARAARLFEAHARTRGVASVEAIPADARLVQFVETELAGAIGSASAHAVVAASVDEEALSADDVIRIVDEASQLRSYSRALEAQSRTLEATSAQLRAANEQLKDLDRMKDEFMSSVTHELRTPLTSIRALAEMMGDDPGMPEAQRSEFLAIIRGETERLGRLVNQVLDQAKIESGHAQWQIASVDLVELARRAVATTAEMFRERGAVVRLEADEAVPRLDLDADRMQQVLMNLLSNAAKFLPERDGRVDLRVRAVDGARRVRVEMRDNGRGVAPAERALIFEKFRQGGDAANRPQGTGLGLPISRGIVEHFGGAMWLDETPPAERGACFVFELPVASAVPAPAVTANAATTIAGEQTP